MKDKELREILEDAGVITSHCNEFGNFINPVFVGEKIDAIANYLGLDFKRVPEKVIALPRVAPQNTMEAANTSANTAKPPSAN